MSDNKGETSGLRSAVDAIGVLDAVVDEKLRYPAAARLLGIPRSTLGSLVCRKAVPHIRLGRRLVVFSRLELEAWLRERTVAVKAVP